MNRIRTISPLRRSLTLETIGCSLAMAYMAGISCPAITEFFRTLGANKIHFGLIGGLPLVMVSLQFVGAAICNKMKKRKLAVIWLVITMRLLYLFIAFLPLLQPNMNRSIMLGIMVSTVALSFALHNLAQPMWYSWMSDLIPSRVFNTYWGVRQRWTMLTWTFTFLSIALFTYLTERAGWKITTVFQAIAIVTVIAGVIDMILHRWIDEPENTTSKHLPILHSLLAPFQHKEFRTFLIFNCAWAAALMFAASFVLLYCLEVLEMSVWRTTVMWSLPALAGALVSKQWGRIADKHGHKPILMICVFFKPLALIAFSIATNANAFYFLLPFFFVDSIWNTGNQIAKNGYMMTISPKENRPMFIAATMGLAGLSAGLAAIAAGFFLRSFSSVSITALGREWCNYHLLFAVDFILRVGCFFLLFTLKEPKSSKPVHVLIDVIGNIPFRLSELPAGLYRKRK